MHPFPPLAKVTFARGLLVLKGKKVRSKDFSPGFLSTEVLTTNSEIQRPHIKPHYLVMKFPFPFPL
ncbi:hypothetical protein NSTC731_05083 [Nostoc sp. DSM 114167]|jgi:hypothetical protein